jgi:membrane-associated phospholipid phosphatase
MTHSILCTLAAAILSFCAARFGMFLAGSIIDCSRRFEWKHFGNSVINAALCGFCAYFGVLCWLNLVR